VHDEWGICDGYHDVAGRWHATSDETRRALRDAMGEPQPAPPMWFVVGGERHELRGACDLVLEDGDVRREVAALDADVPLGYHELVPLDGGPTTRLVVHPRACPPLPRAWGVAVQTYALWSEGSWGIGDLRDVRLLAERLVAAGGGAMLLSPLHQPAPVQPIQPSPYYPSTRRAWNPLLVAMDAPPPPELRCRPGELIDRDAAWSAKLGSLRAEFDARSDWSPAPGPVETWNARRALGAQAPPAQLEREAAFHAWVQARIGEQLDAVRASGVALIGDLAVGFDPAGADGDEWRELLAGDVRLGAPPDPFNEGGQDWGISPFVPWRLRAAGYAPFVETVRACLHGVDGLRIDHVMGLFRQFWVPPDGSAAEGTYVEFPAEELLAILALEATRAGAFVIGEDLGTVEPDVRRALAEANVAGTKVLWFEDEPPARWAEASLATVTTHDLPTIAAVFAGDAGDEEMRSRLERVAPAAPRPADAVRLAHDALLASPAALRLVTTDDLTVSTEQPNRPGRDDHPNWRLRLSVPVQEIPLPVASKDWDGWP